MAGKKKIIWTPKKDEPEEKQIYRCNECGSEVPSQGSTCPVCRRKDNGPADR